MSLLMIIVVGAIALALIFDLINGFHDSANSIATVVSTQVLSPRVAVWWAAFFNFVAMFVFPTKVANTIAHVVIIDPSDKTFVLVVLAGLVGAVLWDLLTWWWGLPTSSSHALIGGIAGAGLAYKGFGIIHWDYIWKITKFIPLAPIIGLALGVIIMFSVIWIFRRWRPLEIDRLFRKGQLMSAALYSLGHGGNDAQKTMGVIVALLIAAGIYPKDIQLSLSHWNTAWIVLGCHLAMGLGTAMGGWRIVKTMGMKITKLKPVGGFCAVTAGAMTLFLSTHLAIPVSTTHTITGAIIGVGATTNLSGIKWGVAKSIAWAWLLTIPLSAIVSALCFHVLHYLIKL
jgi:PiT family inorganic phosphate transporter